MGFKMSWSVSKIKGDLQMMSHECRYHGNDGFTQFAIKKDLMEIKFLLEDLLENCPTFVGEEEWLHERLVNKLSK
jgi:hypothetical protein